MSWHEERAQMARLAIGATGFLTRDQWGELIDWLARVLTVVCHTLVRKAELVPLDDGRGLILIPRRRSIKQIDWDQLHEAIHWLLQHGAVMLFAEGFDLNDPQERELMRLWEQRQEQEVLECMLAILMPEALVGQFRSDHELAEAAGVTVDLAIERRRMLRSGRRTWLREPPSWSAWQVYEVRFQPSTHWPRLRVDSKYGNGRVFEVPLKYGLERDRFQLNADLMALTPDEFHLLYADCEVPPAEKATMTLRQMYEWIDTRAQQEELLEQ